jgi:hypothetical protein
VSGGEIDTRRLVFVVADVSGYTRFARLHRLSQAHAESIVCELLDAVITHTAYPLTLNELLGDAAFFSGPSGAGGWPVFAASSAILPQRLRPGDTVPAPESRAAADRDCRARCP